MADQAIINTSTLTSIGDAIREKTGKSDTFLPSDMPAEILAIETGSDVSGVTAGAGDVRKGKIFVNSTGTPVNGTLTVRTINDVTTSGAQVIIPNGIYDSSVQKFVTTATQATPSISVSSSGLITASCTQSSGYVSGSTKSATLQLSSSQDADFIARNIKNGVNIFGISGNFVPTIECFDLSQISSTGSGDNSGVTININKMDGSGYSSMLGLCLLFGANNDNHLSVMYNNSNDEGYHTFSDANGFTKNVILNSCSFSSSTQVITVTGIYFQIANVSQFVSGWGVFI